MYIFIYIIIDYLTNRGWIRRRTETNSIDAVSCFCRIQSTQKHAGEDVRHPCPGCTPSCPKMAYIFDRDRADPRTYENVCR